MPEGRSVALDTVVMRGRRLNYLKFGMGKKWQGGFQYVSLHNLIRLKHITFTVSYTLRNQPSTYFYLILFCLT